MAEPLLLVDPATIHRNPENPRIIFHEEELQDLEESIGEQGILVPLSVYREGKHYVLLDGERRWRCARKLGLKRVPVLVQPKPTPLRNIMMMFAIHGAQKAWDPLPTAMKLQQLEKMLTERNGKKPTERELAALASLAIGELRRLKKLMALPQKYRSELMEELEKPRSKQVLKVDHILEITRGAAALRKREVIQTDKQEDALREALIEKVRTEVIKSTVEPRRLPRLARAVQRSQVPLDVARRIVVRLIEDPKYSPERAFSDSVESLDYQHTTLQLAQRLSERLTHQLEAEYEVTDELRSALTELKRRLQGF